MDGKLIQSDAFNAHLNIGEHCYFAVYYPKPRSYEDFLTNFWLISKVVDGITPDTSNIYEVGICADTEQLEKTILQIHDLLMIFDDIEALKLYNMMFKRNIQVSKFQHELMARPWPKISEEEKAVLMRMRACGETTEEHKKRVGDFDAYVLDEQEKSEEADAEEK